MGASSLRVCHSLRRRAGEWHHLNEEELDQKLPKDGMTTEEDSFEEFSAE